MFDFHREYDQANAAMQGMKFVMAKHSTCAHPSVKNTSIIVSLDSTINEMQRPSIYKYGNGVVYEYLTVRNY